MPLTYNDFRDRIDIQDVLRDAGYHLNRRDGLRWPSYVRVGSDGRRVSGDKFIVTANGKGCFHPPEQKVYSVVSFIIHHAFIRLSRRSTVWCRLSSITPTSSRSTVPG